MSKTPLLLVALLFFVGQVHAQLDGFLKKAKEKLETVTATDLSQGEIGSALKEALTKGASSASQSLSLEDGYYQSPYKILIPEDARKVTNKLKAIPGWADVEKNLEEKMNRAAESAAIKAKPIFINAIKSMSFQDATNILMGEQDAATQYLHKTTYQSLFSEFLPIIQSALDEVNARDYWRNAVTTYNKIPFISKANPELDDYVTNQALDGLFKLVAKKELGIREDVSLRNTDLLKKVFAKQD